MYICTLFLNSISYLNSSMKKGEGETIRKLKFEDYEIGRVLGKGRTVVIQVALVRSRWLKTKRRASMWH